MVGQETRQLKPCLCVTVTCHTVSTYSGYGGWFLSFFFFTRCDMATKYNIMSLSCNRVLARWNTFVKDVFLWFHAVSSFFFLFVFACVVLKENVNLPLLRKICTFWLHFHWCRKSSCIVTTLLSCFQHQKGKWSFLSTPLQIYIYFVIEPLTNWSEFWIWYTLDREPLKFCTCYKMQIL